MRRSRNIDHGGGMSRQNISTGPLISDHIRDLDLELELLKRKRQMLEQQQSLFQPLRQETQQRNYNLQSYSYNENVGQGSSNHDFSQLYDNGRQQNRKPFPKKRPSDNTWQYDSYPKKSAGYGRGYTEPSPIRNQKSFASSNQPNRGYSSKPVQGRLSIGQRITNQKPQIPEKNFVLKTITSSKAFAPPNKIASQPVPERNRLVADTMKSVAATQIKIREQNRLLPDIAPTHQMKGRMEMSLGAILSNIREVYADSPHLLTLRSAPFQRIIKQGIRDRIRTALLGRIVGTTKEIIQVYRNMFPKETDREIVDEAIKAIGVEPEEKPVESVVIKKAEPIVRSDDNFKDDVVMLLNSHLHEMFNKIEEIYNNEPDVKENSNNDIAEIETTAASGEQSTAVGDKVPKNDDKDAISDCVIIEDSVENNDVVKNDDDSSKVNTEAIKKQEDEIKAEEYEAIKAKGDEAAAKLGITDQTMYKKLLPRIMKRHIPAIVKMINVNRMYREAVGDLIAASKAKYLESKEKHSNANVQQFATTENTSAVKSTSKKSLYPLPYYIKLMGKPQLPKKHILQPFLEEFNPKSIKKHRTIHNLLFIGFTDKSDFDAMVEANGTVIGRSTLSIRICENSNENKESKPSENTETNPNSSTDAATNQNSEDLNSSTDNILGGDLNGQIDDLLSAVKQDEENMDDSNLETPQIEKLVEDENKAIDEHENNVVGNENISCPEIDQDAISNEPQPVTVLNEAHPETISNEAKPENVLSETVEPQEVNSDSSNPNPPENKEIELKNETEKNEDIGLKNEKNDQVSELSASVGRSTPTRASSRLAANVTQ